jgi:DNA adenine methylase
MSLWVAHHHAPRRIVISDSLEPLVDLWGEIISRPQQTAARYRELWEGQRSDDPTYFNRVRDRFNREHDAVDLLYLLCRCVKNAVRFNAKGHFTQSVDKRRLGTRPDRMAGSIFGASALLKGRTELRKGDWLATTTDATASDLIYMDPPYLGTSVGRDRRYAEWMARDRLIRGLEDFNERGLRFALSYDGMLGDKEYGPPLPPELNMCRLLLHAGRSSQATLNGDRHETIESLYLSKTLRRAAPVGLLSIADAPPRQRALAF